MKYRQGFVSNSSSSSFIVKDSKHFDECKQILNKLHEDCYLYNDILYTSFISDMHDEDEYYELKRNPIFDRLHEGGHGQPYTEEAYYCVDGMLGNKEVYIPYDRLNEEDKSKIISLSPDLCRECMFELAQMLDSDVYDNGDIVSRLREMIK